MLSKRQKYATPVVGDSPHQPTNIEFPPRTFGKKQTTSRSFQKSWFRDYPWLHYDEPSDSAFCHICIRAFNQGCLSNSKIEPRFISEGYTNWKDAQSKGRGFPGHHNSECHKEAVERIVELPESNMDVGESLSSDYADNRSSSFIENIIECSFFGASSPTYTR